MKKQSFKKRKQKGGIDTEEKKQEPVVESQEKQEEPVVESQEKQEEPVVESQEKKEEPVIESQEKQEEPVVTKEQTTRIDTQGDSDTKNETPTPPEDGLQSEPLTSEDEKELENADLDPQAIDKLAKDLEKDPNINLPSWARIAIKSGAAGKAAEFLNKHPE